MLPSAPPHSAEKFSPAIASGLRSLLVPPPSRSVVVTRALAAASPGCGGKGVEEKSRHGASIDEEGAKAEEEDDVLNADEEEDGCWVSYGRREPRRRLPPPIPSLLARGALRRTRTDDGRLVIRIAPVVWQEYTRARRRGGRLTMQLVEHDDDSPLTLRAPTTGAQEPDDDATSPTIEEGVVDDDTEEKPVPAIIVSEAIHGVQKAAHETLPVVPPSRVPSAGCFEDVFKYSSIGGSSLLHQMPSLIRMVN